MENKTDNPIGVTAEVEFPDKSSTQSSFNIGQSCEQPDLEIGNQVGNDSIMPTPHISGGTDAVVRNYFRTDAGNLTLTDASVPGEEKYVLPLIAQNLAVTQAQNFQQYRIVNLKYSGVSVAPLGTSSGGIIVGVCPDPYNVPGNVPQENTNLIVGLTRSKIVNAKTDFALEIENLGNWKWVKPGADLRLTSFGTLMVITKTPSTQGTQASWATVISGTIEFRGHTFQTSFVPSFSLVNEDIINFALPRVLETAGFSQHFVAFPLRQNMQSGFRLSPVQTITIILQYTNESGLEFSTVVTPTSFHVTNIDSNSFAAFSTTITDLEAVKAITAIIVGKAGAYRVFGSAPSDSLGAIPLCLLQSIDKPTDGHFREDITVKTVNGYKYCSSNYECV